MKSKLFSILLAVTVLLSAALGLTACNNTPEPAGPTKLSAPVVTLAGNVARWEADASADKFEISLDGSLSYVENTVTSKALTDGQTIKVRAVGDGYNYATSAWSNSVTYTVGAVTGEAPQYLGIMASESEPTVAGGVPGALVRPVSMTYLSDGDGNRDFGEALLEYFEDGDNYLGEEYPPESSYQVYAEAGERVYVQIWLNNPDQHTILSLMLNGTKYQVGGGLFSFFVEEGGENYNCVYVAVTLPAGAHTEMAYTVTNIEYISNTFINPDGTDEFMNNNDTVYIGMPYNAKLPEVTEYTESLVGIDRYEAELTLSDADNLAGISGGWLGVAVYDGKNIVYNEAILSGECRVEASGLVENKEYTVIVYIYADLHDGAGVSVHEIESFEFTTLCAVEYFEATAEYYQTWAYPEIGVDADSGLAVNVSFALASESAVCDRLELYCGEELVYTDNEFSYYTVVEDLLADTEYLVRVYYSDEAYSERYIETTVTTGTLEVPEMTLKEQNAFLTAAAFTFDYIENGYLGVAITKNIKISIYRDDIWQLEYIDWVLKLCDDPTLYDSVQAEFDEAIANNNWGLANKIDHERLTYLRMAKEIIEAGELGNFGYDAAAWEAYLETVSKTFALDTESFFGSSDSGNAYLIFRNYFEMFPSYCNGRYKITADVNMKDGEGFVSRTLDSGSINSLVPINSENNSFSFDCQIDGMNVTVNPYFRVNYEDSKLLIVSYEIGLYTTTGELVDTLYTSESVNWGEFNEENWISAYVAAMKGEALVPSTEDIIKEFGWRAIFEMLNNVEMDFEDDYVGGESGGTVDGTVDGVAPRAYERGEKNIANERERQILRELLEYNYPEWYEYDLKTTMLEEFMSDEYYYELTAGIDDIDAQLEALISGALNSTISRVIGSCNSGIYHFLTWEGSEEDEIYLGFKTVMESYLEDTGKTPDVDWKAAYRRIMTFEDFAKFYPFGYVEQIEIEIDGEKYPAGTYLIGVSYRYDSYEPGRYETECYYNEELVIP